MTAGANTDADGPSPPPDERRWWKEAVVYQIYPQSFNDSDGDGVGDVQGIVDRLDYLEDLDIDVVWLNPVYDSPHVDDGYDIRDYRSLREEYGDLDDWDRLLEGLHDRDIRLVMDLVVNHTSDEHAWFVNARDGGEYRDYYVWHPGEERDTDAPGTTPGPPDRDPPNNWTAAFGGPAWAWDERSGEYYLHLFHERQPDLDWENPAVRDEICEMMNWWFDRGIDGFRMDVVNLVSKPREFPDGDPENDWVGVEHFANGPRLDEYLAEMHDRTYADRDVMTVGEMPAVTTAQARKYTGPDGPLDMIFHFDHVSIDYDEDEGWWGVRDWDLRDLKEVVTEWQTELRDGWNAVYLGNHDQPRIVSRFGDDGVYRETSAKLLATFLLTLRGTPFLFQGDEIAMTNYPWNSLAEKEDAQTIGRVRTAMAEGRIEDFEEARDVVRFRSRDNARTPVQWDDSPNAGFTGADAEPWLPVNPNHDDVNVADARRRSDSVWHYYRDLIDLRHELDVLVYGDYELLAPYHEQVFAYQRSLSGDRVVVLLNWSGDAATVAPTPLVEGADVERLAGNYPDDDGPAADGTVALRPWEARVYRVEER